MEFFEVFLEIVSFHDDATFTLSGETGAFVFNALMASASLPPLAIALYIFWCFLFYIPICSIPPNVPYFFCVYFLRHVAARWLCIKKRLIPLVLNPHERWKTS
jgi:hypothetical protein